MAMTLITTNSFSDAASSDFTSSIDSTYKLYIFKFTDVSPRVAAYFGFQANASSQSGYNEVMTTTSIAAYNYEATDDPQGPEYRTNNDQAQGTGLTYIGDYTDDDADHSLCGEMFLFNPSDTTYVTNFYTRTSQVFQVDAAFDTLVGGYINVTAAITNIQFKASTGNIDGTIQMYGVG